MASQLCIMLIRREESNSEVEFVNMDNGDDCKVDARDDIENDKSEDYFLGFVCMSFALPLCPPGRIEEALQLMRDEVANMSPTITTFSEEFLTSYPH